MTPTDPATPDINRPADPQPTEEERIAQRIAVGDLCGRLCRAFGVVPETNQGFQLTVRGGNIPELVVFTLPPNDEGILTDEWATGVEEAVGRGLAFALLPGQIPNAPPARDPGPDNYDAIPEGLRLEAVLTRILPMLGEVINGAYVTADTRDWLTAMAIMCRDKAAARIRDHVYPSAPSSFTIHPFEPSPDGHDPLHCWCGHVAGHTVHAVVDGEVAG